MLNLGVLCRFPRQLTWHEAQSSRVFDFMEKMRHKVLCDIRYCNSYEIQRARVCNKGAFKYPVDDGDWKGDGCSREVTVLATGCPADQLSKSKT